MPNTQTWLRRELGCEDCGAVIDSQSAVAGAEGLVGSVLSGDAIRIHRVQTGCPANAVDYGDWGPPNEQAQPDGFVCPSCGGETVQIVTCPTCGDPKCVEVCAPAGIGCECLACEEQHAIDEMETEDDE